MPEPPAAADGPGLAGEGLRRAIEALLLVAEEPVPAGLFAEVLEVEERAVAETLHALRRAYVDAGHGFVLREVGGGWRLYTEPAMASYVERFLVRGRTGTLSQAALETLAIVAYEQPVTRVRVSEIRGVDADGAVRTLVSRGLVEEVGRAETLGQPLLYGTTTEFLERLGLQSVEELPPLPDVAPAGPVPPEPAPGGYRQARRSMDDDGAPAGTSFHSIPPDEEPPDEEPPERET